VSVPAAVFGLIPVGTLGDMVARKQAGQGTIS
jgi:hypothetical protein